MRSTVNPRGWIDVTVPIRAGMVHWPGDPGVEIERRMSIDRGDPGNLSALSMSAHTGTHIDAPLHFLRSGAGLDDMPLSAMMGAARVIEIEDPEAIRPRELRGYGVRRGEKILFKTRNSARPWADEGFVEDYVYISKEAARMLARRGVRTIGIDYLSVGGYKKGGVETHVTLLKAGIWLIEGLLLSEVKAGKYQMLALPLKLAGADGSPARVLLKKRET